jgi:hypothetical protein
MIPVENARVIHRHIPLELRSRTAPATCSSGRSPSGAAEPFGTTPPHVAVAARAERPAPTRRGASSAARRPDPTPGAGWGSNYLRCTADRRRGAMGDGAALLERAAIADLPTRPRHGRWGRLDPPPMAMSGCARPGGGCHAPEIPPHGRAMCVEGAHDPCARTDRPERVAALGLITPPTTSVPTENAPEGDRDVLARAARRWGWRLSEAYASQPCPRRGGRPPQVSTAAVGVRASGRWRTPLKPVPRLAAPGTQKELGPHRGANCRGGQATRSTSHRRAGRGAARAIPGRRWW